MNNRQVYFSSSSRSVEVDEIVCDEKSTAVGLLLLGVELCGMAVPDATGLAGSSSVPPPPPLWLLSEAASLRVRRGGRR